MYMLLMVGFLYLLLIIVNLLALGATSEAAHSYQWSWPHPSHPSWGSPGPTLLSSDLLTGLCTQAGRDKGIYFPMKSHREVGQMDLWYKLLIRATACWPLRRQKVCSQSLRAHLLLHPSPISWVPLRIYPEHAEIGAGRLPLFWERKISSLTWNSLSWQMEGGGLSLQ